MFKLLNILPGFLALFAALWLIRPLPVKAVWRWALYLLLAVGVARIHLIPAHGQIGDGLSGALALAVNGLHLVTLLLGLLSLAYAAVFFCFRRAVPVVWRPWFRFAVLGVASVLLATHGMWQAMKVPHVREQALSFPSLPPDLHGIRIAVLSDLHLGPLYDADWTAEVVRRVNRAKPDLIVLLGDLVDGSVPELSEHVAPLSELAAPLGVFFVAGNHEYYSGFEPWMRMLRYLGLQELRNDRGALYVGEARLVVAGVADPTGRRYNRTEVPVPDAGLALKGSPQGEDVFTVLLAHQPQHAQENAQRKVDLQLSGHTHGGTVWPLKPLVARYNSGFVSGEYRVKGMRLFVTSGAGVWGWMPMRLGVPSEIVILQLQGAGSEKKLF